MAVLGHEFDNLSTHFLGVRGAEEVNAALDRHELCISGVDEEWDLALGVGDGVDDVFCALYKKPDQ